MKSTNLSTGALRDVECDKQWQRMPEQMRSYMQRETWNMAWIIGWETGVATNPKPKKRKQK